MSEQEQLAKRERRERVFHKPSKAAIDKILAELGCPPLPHSPLESMTVLPDLYLQLGIESFQYSENEFSESNVRYVGLLPVPLGQYVLPQWWHELDRTKRLVLVTQGTIANRDFGQLIAPALTALAEEEDVIVVVTTGGQPIDSIPAEIPANARVAKFLEPSTV
jgi:UDP:flavonoid glycosyltransferase YjiC (YdhE family)